MNIDFIKQQKREDQPKRSLGLVCKTSVRFFLLICLIFVIATSKCFAQEASVEKSMFGVQIGVPPLAVYNEFRLTNSIALRSEISLGFTFLKDMDDVYWDLIPTFQLEPRFYYNLKKRQEKEKRIEGNCGNFWSVNIGYTPGWKLASSDLEVHKELYVIPTWGIKRNIGKAFNYEVALGLGYSWAYEDYYYQAFYGGVGHHKETVGQVAFGLRLAVGYKF